MVNDIWDDDFDVSGVSVGKTSAVNSIQTRSLEQLTESLNEPAQLVATMTAQTAEKRDVSAALASPTVAPSRSTRMLGWIHIIF